MAQRLAIVTEIKRTLRERGITYEQVAKHMKLSHASVKRLFSVGSFTLERIDEVCELLGMELTELVEQMKEREAPVTRLTVAQEREIVADIRLFLMTWLILNRWRVEEITEAFRFTEREVQHYLIKLDRLKIIELQPGNRARLRITGNLSWQPGGPMWRFVRQNLIREFFSSDFEEPGAEFRFYGAMMSEATLRQIKRAIQNVLKECADLAERDRALPMENRTGAAYVFAVRPWQFSGFDQFRTAKTPAKKSG
jgi:transcriptional regulator with XRE-family HTH domain